MSWKTITHVTNKNHKHTEEDKAASGRTGSIYSSRIDKDCECGGELDTYVNDRGETRELHCLDCGARYDAIFTGDGVSSSWARGERLSQ